MLEKSSRTSIVRGNRAHQWFERWCRGWRVGVEPELLDAWSEVGWRRHMVDGRMVVVLSLYPRACHMSRFRFEIGNWPLQMSPPPPPPPQSLRQRRKERTDLCPGAISLSGQRSQLVWRVLSESHVDLLYSSGSSWGIFLSFAQVHLMLGLKSWRSCVAC